MVANNDHQKVGSRQPNLYLHACEGASTQRLIPLRKRSFAERITSMV